MQLYCWFCCKWLTTAYWSAGCLEKRGEESEKMRAERQRGRRWGGGRIKKRPLRDEEQDTDEGQKKAATGNWVKTSRKDRCFYWSGLVGKMSENMLISFLTLPSLCYWSLSESVTITSSILSTRTSLFELGKFSRLEKQPGLCCMSMYGHRFMNWFYSWRWQIHWTLLLRAPFSFGWTDLKLFTNM